MTEPRSERDTLLAYLRHLRREVVRTLRDLDDEQVRRPGVPSGTSLLGIVHHLTGVEQHWFERVFLTGDDVERDRTFRPPAGITTPASRSTWSRRRRATRARPTSCARCWTASPTTDPPTILEYPAV